MPSTGGDRWEDGERFLVERRGIGERRIEKSFLWVATCPQFCRLNQGQLARDPMVAWLSQLFECWLGKLATSFC